MAEILDDQKLGGNVEYADFGKRLLASIIDGLVLSVPVGIIMFATLISAINKLKAFQTKALEEAFSGSDGGLESLTAAAVREEQLIANVTTSGVIGVLLTLVIYVLYFAYFESSAKQATLGKSAMGIKVTDMNGNRISFGKGILRAVVRVILRGILWIVCAFTAKKQNIHDLAANTLVVMAK